MLRQVAHVRTSIAADQVEREIEARELRRPGVRRIVAATRWLLAPFAALAAVAAGALFLLLLQVCGIATILEGVARRCWELACDAVPHRRRDAVPHH